jgi:hypothetical protein
VQREGRIGPDVGWDRQGPCERRPPAGRCGVIDDGEVLEELSAERWFAAIRSAPLASAIWMSPRSARMSDSPAASA